MGEIGWWISLLRDLAVPVALVVVACLWNSAAKKKRNK